MVTKQTTGNRGHVGDWIEARGIYGQTARRGEIVELIGQAPHTRYRVRWDEQHESILYPSDGVVILARRREAPTPLGAITEADVQHSQS